MKLTAVTSKQRKKGKFPKTFQWLDHSFEKENFWTCEKTVFYQYLSDHVDSAFYLDEANINPMFVVPFAAI